MSPKPIDHDLIDVKNDLSISHFCFQVQLLANGNNVVFESKHYEAVLSNTTKNLDHSEVVLPFNAFAPAGNVEVEIFKCSIRITRP